MQTQHLLAQAIEQTCLKPVATSKDIQQICQEAIDWKFHGVCVAPIWLETARTHLIDTPIRLITVVGFPTGAVTTLNKCFEIEQALKAGAHEIDFVINLGWLKEQRFRTIEDEFRQLVELAGPIPLKVILETCYLDNQEKEWAAQAAVAVGITFVKTSTGFGTDGVTIEDVRLLHRWAPNVKASGGVKDTATALALLEAGASRLGTSSGVAIMKEIPTSQSKEHFTHY